jgi:transposase InsO family protein
MRTDLVLDALRMALTRRHAGADVELMHHSDAGRNTPATRSRRSSTTTPCSRRSGQSATPSINALAESFVDSFKTELIRDRVWQTPSQHELAIVEYVAWFNTTRLHEALADRPPAEAETHYATRYVLTPSLNQ